MEQRGHALFRWSDVRGPEFEMIAVVQEIEHLRGTAIEREGERAGWTVALNLGVIGQPAAEKIAEEGPALGNEDGLLVPCDVGDGSIALDGQCDRADRSRCFPCGQPGPRGRSTGFTSRAHQHLLEMDGEEQGPCQNDYVAISTSSAWNTLRVDVSHCRDVQHGWSRIGRCMATQVKPPSQGATGVGPRGPTRNRQSN